MRIGIVSDTHGLLRREVIEGLQGVDHIIHAGDIDKKEVLDELKRLHRSLQSEVTLTRIGLCIFRRRRFSNLKAISSM